VGIAVETPKYALTIFNLHFGKLTLKGYTKGECVIHFEAHVHNTTELLRPIVGEVYPDRLSRVKTMPATFLNHLHCVDISFIAAETLEKVPTPTQVGRACVAGIDPNKPRMRAALKAVLALAPSTKGFTISEFASRVWANPGKPHPHRDAKEDNRIARPEPFPHTLDRLVRDGRDGSRSHSGPSALPPSPQLDRDDAMPGARPEKLS
jgi:hypothetical protein